MTARAQTLTELCDLAAAISSASDPAATKPAFLSRWCPAAWFLARTDGTLIEWDCSGQEVSEQIVRRAASLAAASAAGSPDQSWSTVFEAPPDSWHTWGIGFSTHGQEYLLGCLFRGTPAPAEQEPPDSFTHAAAALAAALVQSASARAEQETRIEHLLAEQQALRTSHSEILAAAVSEREQRLSEQEEHAEQLRRVMMMAADGIVVVDASGRIESFNEAAGLIFGYSSAEVLGEDISLLLPQGLPAGPDQCFDTGQSPEASEANRAIHEVPGRRKDGTMLVLDVALSRVQLGERWIYTAIVRDVTEKRRAEEELRQLHLQNQLILDSAGEGIIGLDQQGRITFSNPAAARLLGWQPGELAGRRFHEIAFHSETGQCSREPENCPVCRSLCGGVAVAGGEETFTRKDGTDFVVQYTSTPIRDGERIAGVVLTFRDITEQRLLEAQLRQAQKMESIGQLAAGIAHEINTPTQYIGDNIRFLQEAFNSLCALVGAYENAMQAARCSDGAGTQFDKLEELSRQVDVEYLLDEIPRAVQQSLEGVERVATIVRSMKEFSHPDVCEKQAVDLNRAIESTLTVSRNEWKYVAELVTQFDPDLPLVTCLPGDINQAVLNLVVNAAHAIADKQKQDGTTEKGTITISTRHDGQWVEIRIADTGGGIPEHIRSRVFDPFFTTKEVGRGTGQGLAIVHTVVVDRHGGTITFETEPGQGTTFIIRLPIQPSVPSKESRP